MKFTVVEVKPENRPKLTTSEVGIIRIMAEHYGLDYGSLHILNTGWNGNQTTVQGFCLVKDGEPVDDVPNWKSDRDLIKKFYDFEREHGFIERTISLKDYIYRYVL